MNALHAITIRHLSATDKLPTRIKLISHTNTESKTLYYNEKPITSVHAAYTYLEARGFEIIGKAQGPGNDIILLSTTFKSIYI